MYIAIILIQLLVSVVVGLYFLRAMRRERQGAAASTPESLREMDKMRKLREIPGVIFDCPKGAFYLMAALPVDNADTFQRWLLEEFNDNGETVMFAPGAPMYATPGKGLNEVRMAYVLEAEKIERAMDILKKAIEVYNAK